MKAADRIKKLARENWRLAIIGSTLVTVMVLSLVFLDIARSQYFPEDQRLFYIVSATLLVIGLAQGVLFLNSFSVEEIKEISTYNQDLADARKHTQDGIVDGYVIDVFTQRLKRPVLAFAVSADHIKLSDLLPGTIGWAAAFQLTLLRTDQYLGIAPLNTVLWSGLTDQRRFAVYRDEYGALYVIGFGSGLTLTFGTAPTSSEEQFLQFDYRGETSDAPLQPE